MRNPEEVLTFWFEDVTDETPIDKGAAPFRNWFTKDDNFDKKIRDKFTGDLIAADQGLRKNWADTPQGLLALIILFDQFPRNMFRNTPDMFAYDPRALELTMKSIQDGADKQLMLIQRQFAYMPLMHSEDLSVQETCLEYFGKLVAECKARCPKNISYYEYSFGYAKRHHEIIAKFGRFPHRNAVLNRTSTPDEVHFLTTPGSSF